MISKELNKKLISAIPELKEKYVEETSWQDGDDTGSHVVYADVLVPFIKEQLSKNNNALLKRIFDFIESLLDINDEYVNEVIALSVIESLLFDDEGDNILFMQFIGEKTLDIVEEIINYMTES